MTIRVVCLRLVGGRNEGRWMEVLPGQLDNVATYNGNHYGRMQMVPTGSVEWDGDRCAEIYVPADKLDLWRAEHQVDKVRDV